VAKMLEIRQSIIDTGYNPDSVLLISKALEMLAQQFGRPDLKDVQDGNTRAVAVSTLKHITHLPCCIIQMLPGL
jgi:hypothetical protein